MQWREEKHHGDWIRGLTAGGCGNPPDQGEITQTNNNNVTIM